MITPPFKLKHQEFVNREKSIQDEYDLVQDIMKEMQILCTNGQYHLLAQAIYGKDSRLYKHLNNYLSLTLIQNNTEF